MSQHTPSSQQRQDIFKQLLHVVLTSGRMPRACSYLSPETVAAMKSVAHQHPDADAHCIAAAYDAFHRELSNDRPSSLND